MAVDHQDAEAAVAAEAVSAVGDRPEGGAEAAVSAAGAVEDAAVSAAVEAAMVAGELFYCWDIAFLAHAILIEQRSEYLVSDIFKLIISFHIIHETHLVSWFSNDIYFLILTSSGIVAAVGAEAADGAVVEEVEEAVEAAMAAAAAE